MLRCSGVFALVFLLAGCAGGSTHIAAASCIARAVGSGYALDTNLRNAAAVPVTRATIVAEFYRNYRFVRGIGSVAFAPALDPGASRTVTVPLSGGADMSPMRCFVSQASYGDGTSEGS